MSFFEELEALMKCEKKRRGLEKIRAMKLESCEPELKPCPVCGGQPIRRFDSIGQHRVACGDHLSTEPMDTKPGKTTVCTHNALKLDELLEEHPNGIPVEKAAPLETVCEECFPSWLDRESRRLDVEDIAAWNAAVDAYEPPSVAESYRHQLEEASKERNELRAALERLRQQLGIVPDVDVVDHATTINVLYDAVRKERDAARQALHLDPREGLADTCRELVEILGCPEGWHPTDWARRIVDERDACRTSELRYETEREQIANVLGSKTTGSLVALARRIVEDLHEAAADAIRYQTRCTLLEKRLAAIRATADGKADA